MVDEEQQKSDAPETPAAAPAKGKGMWIGIVVVVIVIVILLVAVFGGLFGSPPVRKYALDLWYNNDGHYGDTEDELATVLKNQIEECGKIQVTLRNDPWAVYRTNWANGLMDVFLLGWYPDYFDSDDYISPFLSTSGAASLGSFYTNATVDGWITEEQTTTNPSIRDQRFADIQGALADDVPYVPLFSGNAHVAYVNGITDVELHPVSFKWFIMDKPGSTEINGSTSDRIISLDPASAYDYFSIEVINQVFDTLLVYEPVSATIMPGLAREVPTVANGFVSSNGLNYTFRLKDNLFFHDGSELNATVVARSIDRAIRLDIGGSAAFLLYDVGALGRAAANGNNTQVGRMTVDASDRNITFHLPRAVSFFNDLMAFSVSAPVPWTYSQTGEQPSTVPAVVGSGPYRLTAHTANIVLELDRYAGYHSPTLYATMGIPIIPVEDKVTINIRSTATALKQDIETHASSGIDVVYRTLTPTDLTDLSTRAATLGITVDVGASPQIRYLVINVNRVPEEQVRQAIAYSVDRAEVDSLVFASTVEPLYSMIPSNMPYTDPVFNTVYGGLQNCTSANNLLTQLGFSIRLSGIWIARDR